MTCVQRHDGKVEQGHIGRRGVTTLGGGEWSHWEEGSGHIGRRGVVTLGGGEWPHWEEGSGHIGRRGVVTLGEGEWSHWEKGSVTLRDTAFLWYPNVEV